MKKIILIVVIILILLAIPITLFLVKQRQDLRQRAVPATSLYFEPASVTKNVNDTFTLNIGIDTATNLVAAVELHINYNASEIEVVSLQNGNFLLDILVEPDLSTPGLVLMTIGSTTANAKQGIGTLAVLTLRALSPTSAPSQITTDGSQGSATEDLGVNIINSFGSASVTISGGVGASPTPVPSPTPGGATPAPSPTPGAAVTAITSPANGSSTTNRRPTISGTSFPNALVQLGLTLSGSSVLSSTVNANASGGWSFTPTTDLALGTYTVTVTGDDPNSNNTQTATSTFTITSSGTGGGTGSPSPSPSASGTGTTGGTGTDSGVPVTGSTSTTFLLLGIALIFVLFGTVALVFPK